MRTTVEITAEQRAQLLKLAARRGEKGFSGLVREALETYLAHQRELEEKRFSEEQQRTATDVAQKLLARLEQIKLRQVSAAASGP